LKKKQAGKKAFFKIDYSILCNGDTASHNHHPEIASFSKALAF